MYPFVFTFYHLFPLEYVFVHCFLDIVTNKISNKKIATRRESKEDQMFDQ